MKKYDFIPASVAAVAALVLFILFHINAKDGALVIVYVDNKEYSRHSLYDDFSETVRSYDNTGSLEYEIKNNSVYVKTSECNNKICVNTGSISKSGQTIVCLPQRIVIAISSDINEYDGFTN